MNSNFVWAVYKERGELYSMWCTLEVLEKLKEVQYWKDVPSDYWWNRVKESRRKDPIEGKVTR